MTTRRTPTVAEARGMREALVKSSPSGGAPYLTLDLDSEVDRRIIGSVYAQEARAAMPATHTISAWNCNEPYDGMTYGDRTCLVCS